MFDLIEKNLAEKLQYIPKRLKSMQVMHFAGTLIVDSGLTSDTFNTACGGKINREHAQKVMDYYLKRQVPMAWWFGASSENSNESRKILLDVGFEHDELDIGMCCDLRSATFPNYPMPPELEIVECKSPESFGDFGDILASTFEPIDNAVKLFYKMLPTIPLEERHDLKLWVGYVNGKAVAIIGLFVNDLTAGIYDFATRSEDRGKGYGSALFRTAMKKAQDIGLSVGVLQASPDGLNLYKRFGFQELGEFHVWSNKSQL